MKAYQVLAPGQAPELGEVERPEPRAGQVRLRIAACGLNFADLLMISGQYQDTPPAPFTLGLELAGTIDALGGDTGDLQLGDRVAVFAGSGGLAEYGCFDTNRCTLIPDAMPFTDAAAFQVAYGTSHLALDHRAALQPGETLLVLGAAGGVGLTAVEIGKQMGARVIAVARGADKLNVAQSAGAAHLIDSNTQDIRTVVKDLGGADVVYDPVGGDQFKAAMRACNPLARIITIGFASGEVPQIPANILLVKNLTVIGHYWGAYAGFAPDLLRDSLRTLLGWYSDGRLHPHISHALPLDQAGDGLALLRSRKSTGKVVITP